MGSKLKKIALPLAAIGIMAATGGTATPVLKGALAKGAGSAKAAALLNAGKVTAATGAAPTGIAGLFSKMAGSTIGKGLMANLAKPLSLKGAATYGALGMAGKGLMADKQRKLDTSKDDDKAQAAYDYHMMMSRGIMSPEDARKAFATYGKGMKGDYTPGTEMGTGRYEELYPALNYSGLTRYNPNPIPGPTIDKEKLREYNPYVFAADGGRIGPSENAIIGDDELSQRLFEEIYSKEESPDIEASEEMMNFSRENDELNKQRMEETLRQYQELLQQGDIGSEEMNMGGRVGFDMGGYASFKDVIEQFAESLSPDEFDAFIEMDRDQQIKIMTNAGVLRDDYAVGGSVPQTKSIPQGMQIDGRGGGFIPMGAKEKHDDVPAMLAKNEFVMTSDAVKAAGGGSVNKGAQVMYDLMNSLESKV